MVQAEGGQSPQELHPFKNEYILFNFCVFHFISSRKVEEKMVHWSRQRVATSHHRSSTHIKCSLAPPSHLLLHPTTTSVLLGSYADILLSVILGLCKVQRRRNFDALSKLHCQSCFLYKVFKEELLTYCSTRCS